MDKIEIIARRILGWKMNRLNTWFNQEENSFIHEFRPDEKLEHAMMIVERFERFGFTYTQTGEYEVTFHNKFLKGTAHGETLAKAITNAAYEIAENNPIASEWF